MARKASLCFRPVSYALALEPRLLFDGAGAVAAVDGFDAPDSDSTDQPDHDHMPSAHGQESTPAPFALAGILADEPEPAAGLSLDPGLDGSILIGSDVTVRLNFDNAGSAVGYGPFADLFFNHRGADGSDSDFSLSDGLNFKSAQFFGVDVEHSLYTLTNDSPAAGQLQIVDGKITHPISGIEIDVPLDFGAGDQLLVVVLPFGSFTPDQLATIDVTFTVDARADPDFDLKIAGSGGFMFGADPLDNPGTDPALHQATPNVISLSPRAFTVDTILHAPEGETATGPNFVREVEIIITPADGTTLSDDTTLRFTLPDGLVFVEHQFTPPAGWVLDTSPQYDGSTTNDTLILKRAGGQPITAQTSIRVPVYVTETLQLGGAVIDAASGAAAAIVFGTDAVRVSDGQWQGLAGSDLSAENPGTDIMAVDVAAGVATLTARSVQVIKDQIYKNGSATAMGHGDTVVPCDTLEYRLQVDISDFFRTGSVVVTDILPDGLTFDQTYVPTLGVHWQDAAGQDKTSTVDFDPANVWVLSADGSAWTALSDFNSALPTQTADGKTHFRFDLSRQLEAGAEQLLGGLINTQDGGNTLGDESAWATGTLGTGATKATISFKARVQENYRTDDPLAQGQDIDHKNLKERDVLANYATVEVEILRRDDGSKTADQSDDSHEAVSLPAGELKLAIASITRGDTTYSGAELDGITLAAGDKVTYKISYELPIGDYENLSFDAWLPMPVFDLATGSMSRDAGNGDKPAAGQWNFGSGTTSSGHDATVTVGDNNRITFVLGDSGPVDSSTGRRTIEIVFAAQVTNAAMSDRLLLTAQGQHQDSSSQAAIGTTGAIRQIIIGQPDVHVYKGYTGVNNTQTGETDKTLVPGDHLNSGNVAAMVGNNDATGFDGGDTVNVTIAVENQGSSARGAFNVQLRDTIDANLEYVEDSIKIHRGDGTELGLDHIEIWDGTSSSWVTPADKAAIWGALQSNDGGGNDGIRLKDDDNGALGRGKSDAGDVVQDGTNLVYISYAATVKASVTPNSDSDSTAQLVNFANAEAGDNFLATPREDSANIAFRANTVGVVITATPDHDDTGVALNGKTADAVIGEYVDYQVTINLAEATTKDGQITIKLGSGLGLVSVGGDSGTGDGGVTTIGNVNIGYAGFNLAGSSINGNALDVDSGIASASLSAIGANNFTVSLGDIVNADNDAGDETLTLSFRAVVLNTAENTAGNAGAERTVTASFTNTASDAPESDRKATVTVREPVLTATLAADKSTVSADSEVTYTLTISNDSGYAAHDVKIREILNEIANDYLTDIELTSDPDITGSGTSGTISGSGIGTGGIEYDISVLESGQSFSVSFKARVVAGTPFGQDIVIDPTISWTSIPGDASERNAIDSTSTDSERGGVVSDGADDSAIGSGIDNYSLRPAANIIFATPRPQIYIDSTSYDGTAGPSDPDTTGDDAACADMVIGETVRIRMVVELPESSSSDMQILPGLPAGLQYVGNATVALLSDKGIESTVLSDAGATGSDPLAVNPIQPIELDGNGRFILGDLNNKDRDQDTEYIIIEFDAIVANVADNRQGGQLQVNYTLFSGDTKIATSGDVSLTIVEPMVSIDKQVSAVSYASPNPADNGAATVTYSITISNNGDAVAHDVSLKDILPAGATVATQPSTDSSNTGITNNSGNGAPDFVIKELAVGESITVTYSVTVNDRTAAADAHEATVIWTSLPGDVNSGQTAGERDGTGNPADPDAVNNYRASDAAAFATISGSLWDDTMVQDGVKGADELRLDGVMVTLTANSGPMVGNTLTTITDSNGVYNFGALPVGDYTIVAGNVVREISGDTDTLIPRWDADGAANGLGTIAVTGLSEGDTSSGNDIGYLQENDPPVVSFDDPGASRSFVEGVNTAHDQNVLGTPISLGAVTISDPELNRSPQLDSYDGTSLMVGRSNGAGGFDANAEDLFSFDAALVTVSGNQILVSGIHVANYSQHDGELLITFNGSANANAVNTVASAIMYANLSQNPSMPHGDSRDVTLRYRFDDANNNDRQGYGGPLTGDATVDVTIIAQNDPPVAQNNANSVTEDANVPATGNLITDTDPDHGTDSDPDTPIEDLRVTRIESAAPDSDPVDVPSGAGGIVVQGKYGSLLIHQDGSYTYTLDDTNPDVNGLQDGDKLEDEVFTYTLSDGDKTDTATLAITIHGRTDGAPQITPVDGNGPGTSGHASVYEKGLVSGDSSETTTGTLDVNAPDGLQQISIGGTIFTVADLLALDAGNPSAPIDTGPGLLHITGITITVGPESVPISAQVHYEYTLKARQNHAGTSESLDDIALELKDINNVTATSTLSVQIVDDVPGASPDTGEVKAGETMHVDAAAGVLANDDPGVDGWAAGGGVVGLAKGGSGQPLTGIGAGVRGDHGTLTMQADGSYTYVADPLVPGAPPTYTEVFTYTVRDADGDETTSTLTLTVINNQPPVANDDSAITPEDTPVSGNVIGNGGSGDVADTDPDGDTLTVSKISIGGLETLVPADGSPADVYIPDIGRISIYKTGAYTFVPDPDWNGTVPPITYTLDDGNGGTDTARLNIIVTPVQDAHNDTAVTPAGTPVNVPVLGNDSFSDPGASITSTTPPANGSVQIMPDGSITYTPRPGFSGTDTYTYTVTTGGGITETATVTITVYPEHQPPVPPFQDQQPLPPPLGYNTARISGQKPGGAGHRPIFWQ